uniref:Uncharacterized protein n=1 Tax=Rheinheimera sp. BAL341 TaxID=1708203 RepID=A0A486XNY8_9GAMM
MSITFKTYPAKTSVVHGASDQIGSSIAFFAANNSEAPALFASKTR